MSDALFHQTFDRTPDVTVFTPGRVNLIGEHTDYNGGWALPMALPIGITISLAARDNDRIRVRSDSFDHIADRRASDDAREHWSDYIVGAVKLAQAEGFAPSGADIAVTTTLPFGAGISSSAAVTVGTLTGLDQLAKTERPKAELATLARRVENDFIGMPCGIMDQMAVAISQPGQALALDTKTLAFDRIDLPESHHMAVIHSGVFRQLNEGRYKARKEECDTLKAALGHDDLCLISDAELASLDTLDSTLVRRARHCVSEHRRTVKAAQSLSKADMDRFGALMNASHVSMRDDFEITVPAIDALVEDAQSFGAVGARMTGGGFGGCIVACVDRSALTDWRESLLKAHPDARWVC